MGTYSLVSLGASFGTVVLEVLLEVLGRHGAFDVGSGLVNVTWGIR